MNLIDIITERLQTLAPTTLNIQDDSAMHAGHAGNQGGGHFTLTMTSSHFSGKSPIMRHRLIYQALADLMPNKIHALSIKAYAPDDIK
ncbi:MAG: BolA family transcriptional regulator [Methylotenera sp.]|nr:BolA family transcriptional regulator [Methylotenera sp.]